MIKTVTLRNFQAHKDSTFEMDKGVNVIVGSSDRGKSSIIRGLLWVLCNSIAGTSFIRHGAKEAEVEITLSSGDVIKRVRGNTKNEYYVNDKLLKAPGREVPPEVTALCALGSVNTQEQHDSPFMLSETAGEVGRILNKTVDLTVIDRILKDLNSKKRENESKKVYVNESIEELVDEIKELPDIPTMKEGLSLLLKGAKDIADMEMSCTRASRCIEDFKELKANVERSPDYSNSLKEIEDLEDRAGELEGEDDHFDTLHSTIRAIKECMEDIKNSSRALKRSEKELKNEIGKDCPVCGRPMEDLE